MQLHPYPLIFEPIYKPKIWGGRKLETLAGKRLPPDEPIGESWELADLEDDQSVVANGPAKGKTLSSLVREWGTDLVGRAPLFEGRFPLLIKFLDARETLSVQVHPNESMARELGGRVRLKNEAWYVLDAEPDGCIYRGLKPGIHPETFRRAVERGDVEPVLHRIPVRRGHCYYLPSGTVHALGAGVVVAEVQTPSDVTYRVYDWARVDPKTGSTRELHVDQAMRCISFVPLDPSTESPQHVASVWTSVTSLVRCGSFVIERVRMACGVTQRIPHLEMVIWIVLEGAGTIACNGLRDPVSFAAGDTVLLPAGLEDGQVAVNDDCLWLEVTVPVPSSLSGYDRPEQERRDTTGHGGGLVGLKIDRGGQTERG